MPRKIYIQIHGTTNLAPIGAAVPKFGASLLHSDLFMMDTATKLIPLAKAPIAARNFSSLYDDVPEKDRLYLNWSGNLGPGVWDEVGEFLSKEIGKMAGDEEAEVIILGHSHGGNIGRIAAENLKDKKNIKFDMITVATPLSVSPPILMPDNVKTWQHFYHDYDMNAYIGSWLMQGVCSRTPVKRKIEEVLAAAGEKAPAGGRWQSHKVPITSLDPHDDSMRGEGAKFICQTVKPFLSAAQHEQKETDSKQHQARRPKK